MATTDPEVYEAIENDVSIEEFKEILAKSKPQEYFDELDCVFENFITPLGTACKLKRVEIVRELLEHTTEYDKNTSFWNALCYSEGNLGIVSEFVKAEVKINHVFYVDSAKPYATPLWTAIAYGNEEIINYLIDNGADVHFRIGKSFPLFVTLLAFKRLKKIKVVKIMLENGVDVNENEGYALRYAFEQSLEDESWIEVLDLLVKYGADFRIKPFLCYAAVENCIRMVQYVMDWGLKASEENTSDGHTALHVAKGDSVEVLLKWGSDVNAKDKKKDISSDILIGHTPLFYASSDGDLDKVLTLLDYGADVSILSQTGDSVFFHLCQAILHNYSFMTYLYYKSGFFDDPDADLDEIDDCAEKQFGLYRGVAEVLLAAGASLNGKELDLTASQFMSEEDTRLWNESGLELICRIKELLSEIKTMSTQPKTLQDLCQIQIRKHLHGKKSFSVNELASLLPKHMIDILKFKDIV